MADKYHLDDKTMQIIDYEVRNSNEPLKERESLIEELKKRFAEMDTDGDGKISFEEYLNSCRK